MLLLQISQAPDVAPFHQPQQMQTLHRLPIPIEVGQHQETSITISTFWRPVDHIFHFCLAIYNTPYPIESSLCLSLLEARYVLLSNRYAAWLASRECLIRQQGLITAFLSRETEWPLKTRYRATSSEDKPNSTEVRMVTRDECTQRRQTQRH